MVELTNKQGKKGELAALGCLRLIGGCSPVEMMHAMKKKLAKGSRETSTSRGAQVVAWSRKTKKEKGVGVLAKPRGSSRAGVAG